MIEPTPSVILVESRYWVLNTSLLNPDVTPEEFSSLLKNFSGSLMSGGNFSAFIARHPLDNYSEVTPLLKLSLHEDLLQTLQDKYLKDQPAVKLSGVEFWLTDLEILCCYALFTLEPQTNIKKLEEENMSMVDIISALQPDLEQMFRLLETKKVVAIQPGFLFGAPDVLKKDGLHTPDFSYIYNWHIFFIRNAETLSRTIRDYHIEEAPFPYAGGKVYPGWALLLWEPAEATMTHDEIIRRVFIDSISGTESITYDNSIYLFTGFLSLIIQNKKVDGHFIRNACNISHLTLQRTKLWKRNLSVEQQDYHEKSREVSMLENKKTDFDSAEATLLKAVEGIEVKESQRSGHVVELVLSFFAALSLYSIATDIYTMITTDSEIKPIHLFSLRTILIFIATGIVIGFFYLLRKQRNN